MNPRKRCVSLILYSLSNVAPIIDHGYCYTVSEKSLGEGVGMRLHLLSLLLN